MCFRNAISCCYYYLLTFTLTLLSFYNGCSPKLLSMWLRLSYNIFWYAFYRTIVLFNPPASAAARGVNPSVLKVANAVVFTNWLLNNLQQAILLLPSCDVPYVPGKITQAQVASNRLLYITVILIQRAGVIHSQGNCINCQRRGLSPLMECHYTRGNFIRCCSNCK